MSIYDFIEYALLALSAAHNVLTRENWDGAWIGEVVAQAISPFQAAGQKRIHGKGTEVRLPPNVTLALAMALQELATNAVKYGALSNGTGQVGISWTVDRARDIRLVGVTLSRTVRTHLPALTRCLAAGGTVRVVVIDPDSGAEQEAARRSTAAQAAAGPAPVHIGADGHDRLPVRGDGQVLGVLGRR